jgi:large subunit ribosomal protein L31
LLPQIASHAASVPGFSVRSYADATSYLLVQMPKCGGAVVMRKKDIHPEWFEEAKVTCNGEEVMVTSGTKASYNVDIWSGNHPYFQGITTSVVTDEGRVNRFKRRFAGLDSLSAINTVSSLKEQEKEDK